MSACREIAVSEHNKNTQLFLQLTAWGESKQFTSGESCSAVHSAFCAESPICNTWHLIEKLLDQLEQQSKLICKAASSVPISAEKGRLSFSIINYDIHFSAALDQLGMCRMDEVRLKGEEVLLKSSPSFISQQNLTLLEGNQLNFAMLIFNCSTKCQL